ncbi:MAG: CRISPR-associated protein Cas4 [Thermoguttaceae bacterium]
MDLDQHDLLFTVSELLEHLFCPRFTYFERYLMLPEFQERRKKVLRGREVHQVKEDTNRGYLRKRLGVVDKKIDLSLVSVRHHLRGRLDEALFFGDGTAGPLDYKFACDPGVIYRTLRLQSAAYALMIRENFGVPVRHGFLVYTRSRNRVVEVLYAAADFQQVGRVVREMLETVRLGRLPARAPPPRCVDCCYRFICT